ncbi:hypothetical protein ACP6C7_18815 [Mycolicibacterium septicum]|uniref:DUF3806 domain-containing protein n=1 Tax=Mycolicibacterium septicum TaxID=98668 RepID=A0ABW9LRN2_9MYCO
MTTLPTTWRDYTAKLTAAQVEKLTRMEHGSDPRACELQARAYAMHNALQTELAGVPLPHGAMSADEWVGDDGPQPFRTWAGSSWIVPAHSDDSLDWRVSHDDLKVEIQGVQLADGRTKRYVTVEGLPSDGLLPLASVRLLSESLAEAIAEPLI